jgi:hypothetical protein
MSLGSFTGIPDHGFSMARPLIDYFVLDSLANDLESLEDILRLLNNEALGWRLHHSTPFDRLAVVPALFRGIREGLIRAAVLTPDGKALEPLEDRALPAGSLDHVWFELTAQGRVVHTSWEPPAPPASQP